MNNQEDQDQLIFGYPTEKKQIISSGAKNRNQPIIIVQKSKPVEIQFYYDKKTFDYNLMFFAIENYESPQIAWRANEIDLHQDDSNRLNNRPVLDNTSSLISDIHKVQQKSHQNEKSKSKSEQNKKISSRNSDESSLWIKQEQAVREKQQNEADQSDQDESSEEIVKSSLIEGLSAEMELLQSEKKQRQSAKKEFQQIDEQVSEEQKRLETCNEETLILKDLHEEIKQDLEQNRKKQQKLKQIENLAFQNLWFEIKSQNCSRISITTLSLDDFLFEKISSPAHQNQYFALKQKKLAINSFSNESCLWKMGKSKINFQPFMIHLTCYSCGKKTRNVLVMGNESCSLCSNPSCTKQISVEFTKNCFGQGNSEFNQ